jgi:hypothetical protein
MEAAIHSHADPAEDAVKWLEIRRMAALRIELALIVCVAVAAAAPRARAEDIMEPSLRGADRVISLPYGFWNESFGVAAAYVHAVNGYPQPQSALLGTVMAGTEGAGMALIMGQDLRLFGIERLFFDPILSVGYYGDIEAYIDGNPNFPDERAGSNDSHRDDFITGKGADTFYRLRFKYLLPMGSGRKQITPTYRFSEGLLTVGASGATAWNPWTSGRTFLELRPFYRTQNIKNEGVDRKQSTNGAELNVLWDNRDYPGNPERGNALTLEISRDFGLANSSASWTSLNAEYDHYWPLPEIKGLRQSVLAVDFWTSYSPTWEQRTGGVIVHRPPAFRGATLGGLFRMRAYPSQRFSDKAAVYYAAELRMVPRWNFFERFDWLQQRVGVEWMQLVAFGEIGRVAPRYSLDELHRNLRWDAGVGLRVWAKGLVGRVDVAYSEEGLGVQMMIGQPFQF